MYQARILLAAGMVFLTAACGAKVTVDLGGAGGSTSGTGTGAGGTFQNSTAASGVGGSVTAVGSTGGGGCLNTCAGALLNGGTVCSFNGLASMDYTALYTCGCGPSPCAMACNFSLCTGTPLDMTCATCLENACAAALKACESN